MTAGMGANRFGGAGRSFGNTGLAAGNRGFGGAGRSIGSTGLAAGNRAFAGAGRSFGNTGMMAGNRAFGNTGLAGNRSFGNQGNFGGNRINNINRSSFVSNGSNFNRGGGGMGGYRSYGGYGRGLGYGGNGLGGLGYGGYGIGGLGYGGYGIGYGGLGFGGLGYGGFGGGGLGLGLLLGLGLGGFGGGYGGFGGGYGGYGGGYGGYGGGYGGYGGGYGGYGGYGYSDWGYPGYGYGSAYGTTSYANPYLTTGYATQPYDYAQPISTVATVPAQSAADQSLTLFSQARDSFKNGDVNGALQQADSALAQNPNDTSLHEFRALCLFALGRYDDAAVPLYAVLAIGPGWDWATLIGLYPNAETYTGQLRRLEAYVAANPQSATSRFVLAYQYLTEGFNDAAAAELKQVVALKPTDAVATKLLQEMHAAPAAGATAGNSPPAPSSAVLPTSATVPINTKVPEGATIDGTWHAKPNADTSVSLTIQPGGTFRWDLNLKGQAKQFTGTSTFANGILTLVPENIPPIVGKVSWADADHMTFHAVGDKSPLPGLSFTRQQ
jgi:tetratricopeptide (TPR) repeat protein